MTYEVPKLGRHTGRPTTAASARRTQNRIASNFNNPTASDAINPTGNSANAHATSLSPNTPVAPGAGGSATLAWPTKQFDIDGWWSAASNTRITVSFTGIYVVTFQLQDSTPGTSLIMRINKNGSTTATLGVDGDSSLGWMEFVTLLSLTAGDYLEAHIDSTFNAHTYQNGTFQVGLLGTM